MCVIKDLYPEYIKIKKNNKQKTYHWIEKCPRDLNMHFIKRDIQIPNKHGKGAQPHQWEEYKFKLQCQTTTHQPEMTKIKKKDHTKCWLRLCESPLSFTTGQNVTWFNYFGIPLENWQYLVKLNTGILLTKAQIEEISIISKY